MDVQSFKPKTPQEELDMILFDKGDFKPMRDYLEPLISNALNDRKLGLNEETKKLLHGEIIGDIPVALSTFFSDREAKEKNMSFSTFFAGYIEARIKPEVKTQGLWGKVKSALHRS